MWYPSLLRVQKAARVQKQCLSPSSHCNGQTTMRYVEENEEHTQPVITHTTQKHMIGCTSKPPGLPDPKQPKVEPHSIVTVRADATAPAIAGR